MAAPPRAVGAVTGGVEAAWDGLRELTRDGTGETLSRRGRRDPLDGASQSLMLLGFLVFALVALVGAIRRLPLAYSAYAGVALAITVSYPVEGQPLTSLPRYIAVLFPSRCGSRCGPASARAGSSGRSA